MQTVFASQITSLCAKVTVHAHDEAQMRRPRPWENRARCALIGSDRFGTGYVIVVSSGWQRTHHGAGRAAAQSLLALRVSFDPV